jgi:hypothetical protein
MPSPIRNIVSLIAYIVVSIVLLQYRSAKSDLNGYALKVTDWDALGYYMYLPSACIYNDVADLKWFPAIDSQYKMSGGTLYQAGMQDNGTYVFKYLGGVAVLQLPFFLAAHLYANSSDYPPDGFSPPYQYSIAFGAIIYCIIALFLLRRFLLLYFKDSTVALTLLLLCLATNLIQYIAIDGGMSHAYIFPLYVAVLWTTYLWHTKYKMVWALLTGLIIGLATISRPTEAVMLFIPLLWNTHTKEAAKAKWQKVKQYKTHVYIALLGGVIGVLPQLLYWKIVTGSFVYDVGSKWDFLTPHLRVLIGWEKGWFIYTPVTMFFVVGLFMLKQFPFRKSVLVFCLLNIYVIISWADWRYGGSYSTRALVQSYPVFALPFAAFIDRVNMGKLKPLLYIVGLYLIGVNLFQLKQYSETILHYNDMNRKYYTHIYLNPHPTPLDMSLLDIDEYLSDTTAYAQTSASIDTLIPVSFNGGSEAIIGSVALQGNNPNDYWLLVEADVKAVNGFYADSLNVAFVINDSVVNKHVRLFNPITKDGAVNQYAFYCQVPPFFYNGKMKLSVTGNADFNGEVSHVQITHLVK